MLIGMFGHIEADDTRTSLCELTYQFNSVKALKGS